MVAGTLVDEDPQTALAHARAARDRASRLAVVREAVGVAAYHAEDYAEAARELRAYRRMSGDDAYRAVLADCERALGRPDVALRLVAEALVEGPDDEETVELRLVEAGARRDLGEDAAARLVLEAALGGRPDPERLDVADEGQLRIAAAYADLLRAQGDDDRADRFLAAVAAVDPELAGEALGVEFSEVDDDIHDGETASVGDASVGDAAVGDAADGDAGDEPVDAVGEAAQDVRAAADPDVVSGRSALTFDEEVDAEVAELLGESGPDGADSEH